MRIIKLESKLIELVWGSEDWKISAHPNGMAVLKGTDISLKDFYEQNPEKFGNIASEEFPLLMKVIDAKTPLSVQVHPGDEYAKEHENSLGKTECWYILDEKDSDIVIGQKATSREELQAAIDADKVEDTLNIFDINVGDFFYIPAGTVHAIRSNTKILEIQQSSDITYRMYDYHRKDKDGNERELHVEKSLDVINYDYKYAKPNFEVKEGVTTLVESEFFNVYKAEVKDNFKFDQKVSFVLGYVLTGNLEINGEVCTEGEAFIIPHKETMDILGNGEVIYSYL